MAGSAIILREYKGNSPGSLEGNLNVEVGERYCNEGPARGRAFPRVGLLPPIPFSTNPLHPIHSIVLTLHTLTSATTETYLISLSIQAHPQSTPPILMAVAQVLEHTSSEVGTAGRYGQHGDPQVTGQAAGLVTSAGRGIERGDQIRR